MLGKGNGSTVSATVWTGQSARGVRLSADLGRAVAKVEVEVPVYEQGIGLVSAWPEDYSLKVSVAPGGQVRILGDAAGLTGLATQLLALAQADVPTGAHEDLDDFLLVLDEGSAPLRLERG
ncbi:hypothetical protein KALB_7788 [Kutzneria albida DSM 43870]|uniref:Uncharacterized protein n=1 Tax=Kutzneria albida DSM 43870 TaxID=1449976 RepID=W5WK85_9PSEU|nr:hypothetical protein KALB_7788 [Kutzneria albida DSM 43870]